MAYFHFKISLPEKTRLDKFLAKELPQFSRSFLASKCELLVNKTKAKASTAIREGDLVEVKIPPLKELKIEAENIPLQILYEDKDILVISKASGMVTHPTDFGGNVSHTLVNALLHHFKKKVTKDFRMGLIHRLDKDTSGVMVIAKSEDAKSFLTQEFAKRNVDKTYLALVVGKLKSKKGRIEAPIGRDAKDYQKRKISISPSAREAITEFEVIEEFKNASLVKVKILTGRTHQIRVHFASLKHPIVGDSLYGFKKPLLQSPRMFLHAWKLSFTHPKTKKRISFEAKLPKELEEFLKNLDK